MFIGVTFIEGGLYTQTQTHQMQNTIEAARINWEGEEKKTILITSPAHLDDESRQLYVQFTFMTVLCIGSESFCY